MVMGYDKFGTGESFESCDKFGSGGHLYVPDADKPVEPVSPEEAIENLRDAFVQAFLPVLDMCIQFYRDLADALAPQIQQLIKDFTHLYDQILRSYPDKRIVWLALHHKKERIRKKNRRRILKWVERNEKQDG